jgi:diguanylate cyclase (GGDEF)-like protein
MEAVNLLIAIAYFLIPLILLPISYRARGKLLLNLLLATAFILSCGVGHLLEAFNSPYHHDWHKVTALVSWMAVIALGSSINQLSKLFMNITLFDLVWRESPVGRMIFEQKDNDLFLVELNEEAKIMSNNLIAPGQSLRKQIPSHELPAYPYDKALIDIYLDTIDSQKIEFRIGGEIGGRNGKWFRNVCIRIPDSNFICMDFINISEIKESALRDLLTGLYNRAILANEKTWSVVFFCDLDGFKLINDTLGHDKGDEVLVLVAEALREIADEIGCIVVRWGGDEFLLLIKNYSSDELLSIASKCITKIESITLRSGTTRSGVVLNKLPDEKSMVSASIGIAQKEVVSLLQGLDEVYALIFAADIAVKAAKTNKKSTSHKEKIIFYTEAMGREELSNHSIEFHLRNADIHSQLWIAYQPIINMVTGEILGAEALIRWESPELSGSGLNSPARFIPIAEVTGIIGKLTDFVIDRAIEQIKECQKIKKGFFISINVSPVELESPIFVGDIARKVREAGIEFSSLGIEITERGDAVDLQQYSDTLKELSELKIILNIDDFGTGTSSFERLVSFEYNKVKLDRYFVPESPLDIRKVAVCNAMSSLSREMLFNVIVEGIETPFQHEFLTSTGFVMGQGYYFYRPMPKQKLIELLIEKTSQIP